MPTAAIAGGLAAASVGTGIAGAVLADGGGGEGRLKLPPELEVGFLDRSLEGLNQIDRDIARTGELEKNFNNRLDLLEGMINGSIPSEQAIQDLQKNTLDLAKAFGGNTQELIDSGFLTPEIAQELSDLRDLESKDLQDPNLENQINEERRKLEQDLARANVGPAQRSQELRKFERAADEQRFSRAEELRTGKTSRGLQRIGAAQGARDAGFRESLASAGFSSSALDQLFGQRAQGVGALGSIAESRLNAGRQGLQDRSSLRGEGRETFEQFGRTEFSGRTKDALESGLIGPGSLAQQTGIAGREQREFGQQVREQEEAASRRRLGVTRNQTFGSRDNQLEDIKRAGLNPRDFNLA